MADDFDFDKLPKIGNRISNLPDEYWETKEGRPPGVALFIGTSNCPRGKAILVSDGVIIDILDMGNSSLPIPVTGYDALIMNTKDVPEEAIEAAAEMAAKQYH
jgi:hypothetical protein